MTSHKKGQQPSYDEVRILSETAERRHDERISPDLDIPCEIPGAKVVHVLGLSVGATGMRVLTDIRLPHDREFGMTLRLGKDGKPLRLQGTVVWDDEKDFEIFKRYVSGIHFTSVTDADSHALAEYLRQYVEEQRRR